MQDLPGARSHSPSIGRSSPGTVILELSITNPARKYRLLSTEYMTDIWDLGLVLSNTVLIVLLQQTMGLEF